MNVDTTNMRLFVLSTVIAYSFLLPNASSQTRIADYRAGSQATTSPLIDVIQDGSFETGSPNDFWTEASLNFGTPLCTVANCSAGGGSGPRTGEWWAWFGGIAEIEEGSIDQNVMLDVGTAVLTFWLEIPVVCDSPDDYMEVLIDGVQEFLVDGTSTLCGVSGYSEQTVNLDAYADGGLHNIEFHGGILATNGETTNFFIDDVSLENEEITTILPGLDGVLETHNLTAVYPNPFNPQAQFSLEIAEQQRVRIEMYDALGRRVATLYDGTLGAESVHQFQIDGTYLPSGSYMVRAIGERFADARQVTLTK